RNFDDCTEKKVAIHDWVKQDGFHEMVENLEYRVYTGNVEKKLKAQSDAAEAQQKNQSFKNFSKPGHKHYNSLFTNLENESGTAMLYKACPATNPAYSLQHSAVQLKYTTESPQTGVASSIGRRPNMEDNHIAEDFDIKIGDVVHPVQLSGVFDGHGGSEFSTYVKDNIVNCLKYYLETFNGKGLSDAGIMTALNIVMVDLDGRLKVNTPGKIKINGALDKAGNQKFRYPGSAANVAIILNNKLWIANVGDSRALLVDDDNEGRTIQLSKDIKPADVGKKAQARGGFAFASGVMGQLGTGTATGNHHLASVSSRPKVTRFTAEEFSGKKLVQVCDGITDVASSNEIGEVIAEYFKEGDSPAKVAGKLVAQAYAARSGDNLTCMITSLQTLPLG
nr:PP2C family protein-serine/threonine phosphatase [Endozoicomonas sp.]